MQTIRIGDAKWETIEAGNRIELTAYGTAIVQLHSAKVGGSMLRQENLTAGQSMTFGPFMRPVRLYMSAGTGAIEYDEREGDAAGEDAQAVVMVGSTLSGASAGAVRGSVAIALPRTGIPGGDSRTAQGFSDDTTLAGTLTGSYSSRNWYQWLMMLSGQPLRLTQAAGVGGDRVSNFVARQNNPQGGSLFGKFAAPGWVPYAPGWLFLTLGINDILNNVETSVSLAGARQILNASKSTGTVVVWPTELPVGPNGTQLTGAQLALLSAWNEGLKALRAEYPLLRVPDCYTAFLNPATGSAYAGLHNDTSGAHVHLNNAGALLYAQTVYASISSELFAANVLLAGDAAEVISGNPAVNQYQVNPLLSGADATAALQSAVSFGAGATGTATLIDDPEGYGKAIQVDVTYTGTSSAFALLAFKASAANFVGGECIIAAARVRVGLPGASPGLLAPGITPAHMVRCPEHILNVTDAVADGGNVNSRQSLVNSANDAGVRSGFEGISATPIYQIKPGAPQAVQQQLYLRGIGAGSGAVRWIVSRPTIRRVPSGSIYAPNWG